MGISRVRARSNSLSALCSGPHSTKSDTALEGILARTDPETSGKGSMLAIRGMPARPSNARHARTLGNDSIRVLAIEAPMPGSPMTEGYEQTRIVLFERRCSPEASDTTAHANEARVVGSQIPFVTR